MQKVMTSWAGIAVTSFVGMLLSPTFVMAAPEPAKLVRSADEGRLPNQDVSFIAIVTDYSGKKKLRELRYHVKVKPPKYSLVETVFPERQKGRKLLMREDDLWFYSPGLRRPTRVSFQQRLTGEVANGDISRTNFADDYTAVLEENENVGSVKAYRLLLTANKKSVTYQQIRYWISADDDPVPVKAEFLTASGKLLKRAEYGDIKQVLGRRRITKTWVSDAVQKSKRSLIEFAKVKVEEHDASLFNKDSLAE